MEKSDPVIPVFKEYLGVMARFFDIRHYDPWYEGAVKNLQQYTFSDDRYMYGLKKEESIIGFAFINQHLRFNTKGFAVAEFYIQKIYQKKGYGRRLAEHVFAQFPGRWEVAAASKNKSALAFWEHVVSTYTKGQFAREKKSGFSGYGFVFNTA